MAERRLCQARSDEVTARNPSSGTPCARYGYDAWDNCLSFYNSIVGQLNPLRYRGYVYDVETQLYYLQSRYYDPYVGRFINGDGYASTGQGLTGNNMFAYCGNNPVSRYDPTGHAWYDDLYEKVKEVAKTIWNATTDWAVVLAGGGASWIGGYTLAGTLLQKAAVGETTYKASGEDYAAKLIQSHSGFSNQVKEQYKQTNQYTGTGTYEFPVTDGDLGAALHWVNYSYCVLPGEPGKSEYLYVTVTDKFDFKWENISYDNSYQSIPLLLANNAAYIDAQLGGLQTVNIEIIVEIYP